MLFVVAVVIVVFKLCTCLKKPMNPIKNGLDKLFEGLGKRTLSINTFHIDPKSVLVSPRNLWTRFYLYTAIKQFSNGVIIVYKKATFHF